MPVQCNRCNW